MKKIKKEKDSNICEIKEENFNILKNSELKGLIIKEIDNLSIDFKKISKELILLSNHFDINKNNEESKEKISIDNIRETIKSIKKISNIPIISYSLNEISKSKNNEYDNINNNNNIISKEDNSLESNDNNNNNFLNKKRKNSEKEVINNLPNVKVLKYQDNNGNCIGYCIECLYFENKVKFGLWKNKEFVKNLKYIFNKKLLDLKFEDNNDNKNYLIKEFYDKFKAKVYTKYPPLEKIL